MDHESTIPDHHLTRPKTRHSFSQRNCTAVEASPTRAHPHAIRLEWGWILPELNSYLVMIHTPAANKDLSGHTTTETREGSSTSSPLRFAISRKEPRRQLTRRTNPKPDPAGGTDRIGSFRDGARCLPDATRRLVYSARPCNASASVSRLAPSPPRLPSSARISPEIRRAAQLLAPPGIMGLWDSLLNWLRRFVFPFRLPASSSRPAPVSVLEPGAVFLRFGWEYRDFLRLVCVGIASALLDPC